MFTAHRAGEDGCSFVFARACNTGIYVRRAITGSIQTIVRVGDTDSEGHVIEELSEPVLNDRGDVVFRGGADIGDGGYCTPVVYLHADGVTRNLVRAGDPVPFSRSATVYTGGSFALNDAGDVAFSVYLDQDAFPDSAIVVRRAGKLRLVARNGTPVRGVGTIATVQPPVYVGSTVFTHGLAMNDAGDVLLQATLTDGRGVLLLAG